MTCDQACDPCTCADEFARTIKSLETLVLPEQCLREITACDLRLETVLHDVGQQATCRGCVGAEV